MKKRILIIGGIILFLIVITLSIYFIFIYEEKLDIKNIDVELGNKVSTNVKDYISNKDIKLKKIKLDISKYKDEVGKYKYIIKTKRNSYTGYITVKDTTNPVLTLKELTITEGDEINIESFVENCDDLSGCTFSFKNEEELKNNINNGEYNVEIVAKDKYENTTSGITKLIVKEKEVIKETTPTVNNTNTTVTTSKGGIAVLNYHFTISEEEKNICSPSSICMNENLFDEHMKYIKDNGYYTASLAELEGYIDGSINLPEKTVVITIDDGWFVSRAISIFEKYNIHGVLFLIGSLAPASDYASSNLEIASHTWNLHKAWGDFINADRETAISDLIQSKSSLNDTPYFCFPFYQYNDTVISYLQEVGFRMAFVGGNYKVQRGINKYKVPRYVINGTDSVSTLATIIS